MLEDQNPPYIDPAFYEALTKVCDYLADEQGHYETMPKEQQQGHIYHSVKVIAERLECMRASGLVTEQFLGRN